MKNMTPITSISADTGPDKTPSVTVGDSIYYHHPESNDPTHGVVAAVGKHGVTTDAEEGGTHQVLWDKFIGHRKRLERKLTIHDRGEDGTIMVDENGKKVFVRGKIDDHIQDGGEQIAKALMPTQDSLGDVIEALNRMSMATSAQIQGLAAAIAMLAERVNTATIGTAGER